MYLRNRIGVIRIARAIPQQRRRKSESRVLSTGAQSGERDAVSRVPRGWGQSVSVVANPWRSQAAVQAEIVTSRQIAPRPALLIASGGDPTEIPTDEAYRDAGGANVALWTLPDSGHTAGLRTHPAAYERRVIAFLDEALR